MGCFERKLYFFFVFCRVEQFINRLNSGLLEVCSIQSHPVQQTHTSEHLGLQIIFDWQGFEYFFLLLLLKKLDCISRWCSHVQLPWSLLCLPLSYWIYLNCNLVLHKTVSLLKCGRNPTFHGLGSKINFTNELISIHSRLVSV